MTRQILQSRDSGVQIIDGTPWTVRDQLVRDQCPGSRPTWQIVYGLCNGIPRKAREFATLRQALTAWTQGA